MMSVGGGTDDSGTKSGYKEWHRYQEHDEAQDPGYEDGNEQ
jgi:hypothetical protein